MFRDYRLPCTLELRANGRNNSQRFWVEWELIDKCWQWCANGCNYSQEYATTYLQRVCKRTQHATSNNVASVCTGLYCHFNCEFVNNDSFFSFCFSFLNAIREAEFKSKAEMANHLLLFVSALVPKALASLMTSFCIELAKPENVSKIIVYTMKILSSDAFYPSFPFF